MRRALARCRRCTRPPLQEPGALGRAGPVFRTLTPTLEALSEARWGTQSWNTPAGDELGRQGGSPMESGFADMEPAGACRRGGVVDAWSGAGLGLRWRSPRCDASAAVGSVAAAPLCTAVLGPHRRRGRRLRFDPACPWCARGKPEPAPGGAGLPSPSAEAAGGVKWSPSRPSAASCEAVLLTPTDVGASRGRRPRLRRGVEARPQASQVVAVRLRTSAAEDGAPRSSG
jgi:hypothetical protein